MSISQLPLVASTVIIKSGTNYTNSATTGTLGTTEFRLLRSIANPSSGERTPTVDLHIENNNYKWTTTFTAGATVYVAIGKDASSMLTVFGGRLIRPKVHQDQSAVTEFVAHAEGWRDNLEQKTIISYKRSQKRNGDQTLDLTDAVNMRVTDIIVDLMNRTDTTYQNSQNSGISAALTTSSGLIVPSDISIPDVSYVYKRLDDGLKELFDYIGYIWGVDADAKLYGRPINAADDSGVTLDGSTIIDIDVEDDIDDTENRIFVIGSDTMVTGVSSSTHTGGPLNTSSLFLAQKFLPTADDLRYAQFWVDKVGAPANLAVGIYQDDSNKPTGAIVRFSELNNKDVSSTSVELRQVEINQQITTSSPYWIVLFKSADTSNYYRWYTDGGSSGSTATATDGVTWSTVSGTSTFAHQIVFGNPLVYVAEDIPSTSSYGIRELPWRQPEIENLQQAIMMGKGLLGTMGKKKRILTVKSFMPNTVLIPGERVTISNSNIVATTFLMTDCSYELEGFVSYYVQVKAMNLV